MSGFGDEPSSPVETQSLRKPFSKIDIDGHDLPPSPAPSSPRNGRKYAFATELVYTEGNDQYNASSTPIYQVRMCTNHVWCIFLSNRNQMTYKVGNADYSLLN